MPNPSQRTSIPSQQTPLIDKDGNVTREWYPNLTVVSAMTVDNKGRVFVVGTYPTSDPHVAGQVWKNAGVLTVSAG